MGLTKFKSLTERLLSGLGRTKSFFPFYDSENDADYRVSLDTLITFISNELGVSSKAVFELTGVSNTGNNYVSTLDISSYRTEGLYIFKPNSDSDEIGVTTLNINSIGILDIKEFNGTNLIDKTDLKEVNTYVLLNKTSYWLVVGGVSGGSGSGTSLTNTITVGENITKNDLKAFDEHVYVSENNNDNYWLSKFCEFQYGDLSENNNVHRSVLKLLTKADSYQTLSRPCPDPLEGAKDKDKDKDISFKKDLVKTKRKKLDTPQNNKFDKIPELLKIENSEFVEMLNPDQQRWIFDEAYEDVQWLNRQIDSCWEYKNSKNKKIINYFSTIRNWIINAKSKYNDNPYAADTFMISKMNDLIGSYEETSGEV